MFRFKQIKEEEEERRRKEKEEERDREKEKDNDSLTIVEEKSNHEELNEGETDNMPFSLNGGLGHSSDESVTDGRNQNGNSVVSKSCLVCSMILTSQNIK